MNSNYNIIFIYEDMGSLVDIIEENIKIELEKRFNNVDSTFSQKSFNFLHNSIENEYVKSSCIALYFGSEKALDSENCNLLIKKAIDLSIFTIPIMTKGKDFNDIIPKQIHLINVFEWEDKSSNIEIVLRVLENLGLSEKHRKIFISYRRVDGLGMADQLLDVLTRQGFNVFLDKYDVDTGKDVQKEIYNAIDDKSFLLVIESPKAYESEWISKEIHYALRTHMAVIILKWYNALIPIEDTKDLPRVEIKEDELLFDKFFLLKEDILKDLILKIENEHSYGLLRRRNILIKSIEREWKDYFSEYNYLDNWVLYFKDNKKGEPNLIITITPRVPKPYDLYELDQFSKRIRNPTEDIEKILYHQAYSIDSERQKLLEWIISEKVNIQVFRYIG